MNPKPQHTSAALATLSTLYTGDVLPEALNLIDALHSAVSEGELARFTSLTSDEVKAALEELIYVAQETLKELQPSCAPTRKAAPKPILKLVQPDPTHAETHPSPSRRLHRS
ncbi:MAG: hypothetical protein MUC99_03420 [Anaerolineae bacterium]|jgi:hypothetical protein|nr:hypothetical protein [Anaerolineae bacterium]